MGLPQAIDQLEAELASLGQGTATQPKEGTTAWFRLRALATGLSCLRQMKKDGKADDPAAAEAHYRKWLRESKQEARA
jgi:hypothetical protein